MEESIKNISSSSQVGKAPARKAGGGGSNPSLSSNGDVVQWPEQKTLDLRVAGSNPVIASNGGLSIGHSFTTERFNPLSPTNQNKNIMK